VGGQEQRCRPRPDQSRDGVDDCRACEAKASTGGTNCYTTSAVSSPANFACSGRFAETWRGSASWLAFNAGTFRIRFPGSSNGCVASNASCRFASGCGAVYSICTRFCCPSHDSMNTPRCNTSTLQRFNEE
jgi:hypothetical protein